MYWCCHYKQHTWCIQYIHTGELAGDLQEYQYAQSQRSVAQSLTRGQREKKKWAGNKNARQESDEKKHAKGL